MSIGVPAMTTSSVIFTFRSAAFVSGGNFSMASIRKVDAVTFGNFSLTPQRSAMRLF
jgi:hypothetical protein